MRRPLEHSKPHDEAPEPQSKPDSEFGHGLFKKARRGPKEPKRNVPLRARDRLGKYRIVRCIGGGGFARVYEAIDKVEGTHVALKVPRAEFVTEANLEQFRREVRTHATLDHPNILPIKNADLVGDVFVIAVPLGKGSLADRMRKRMSVDTFLCFAAQMIGAVAHAHQHQIVHCDVKPENFLLFDDNRLRLADFGIARIAQRKLKGSGSGTIGYIAPEQAMGKPSFRSDVFSLGLLLWEMLTGELPDYPFESPLAGSQRLRRRVPTEFAAFLQRTLHVDPKKRFADARRMLAAFEKIAPLVRRFARGERTRRTTSARPTAVTTDWRQVRFRQFLKQHRSDLALDRACRVCAGPMSEAMHCCPWCGIAPDTKRCESKFPARCDRCHRGRKLDWKFCAWCHGKSFEDVSTRTFSDLRYTARCEGCSGSLMPFSRYCPWCRRKTTRAWKITGIKQTCPRCGWGVVKDYWSRCAWCGLKLGDGR